MEKKSLVGHFFAPAIVGFSLLAVLSVLLPSFITSTKNDWQGPNSGLWYCKELQLQLCFQLNLEHSIGEDGWVNTHSYALVKEVPIMCDIFEHAGTHKLRVINQDVLTETDVGELIFEGQFVNLDDQEYAVRDKYDEVFTFHRVKEFSLEEARNTYQEQIDAYNGTETVGPVQHIAIAVQKAKELWQTELKIDTTAGEVIAAFDLAFECWFISTDAVNSPAALIDINGNVIGVW